MNLNNNKQFNRICVLGLGYIGLPTASMLAIQCHKVIGVDIDKKKVDLINNNNFTINEHGLNTLLSGAISSGNLIVKTKPEQCSTYIICVPTPAIPIGKDTNNNRNNSNNSNNYKNNGKTCDLSNVMSAINSIKPYLKDNDLIIIESTISPKTTENIYNQLIKELNINIYMAYCPERVLPGNILKELVENDRIIGGVNNKSAEKAKEIYETFVEGNIYLTDSTTAELVKLMENTFRDTNIALANEFAKISTELNIDVWKAINLANKHPRVNILNPGPGVGGHCISIDPWFIVGSCKNTQLIKQSRIVNDNMPYYVSKLICEEFKALNIKNPKIGILGITYKGNVEDTRETPALPIIQSLLNNNFKVSIYDPYAKEFNYKLCSFEEALKDSDGIIFLTDHNQFKNYTKNDLKKISKLMTNNKIVIDTKNILNHKLWKEYGFNIKLLGNGKDWLVKDIVL